MNRKILVADDDDSVRRMVARVVESAGYTAVTAGTGQEAVLKFRSAQPHLVLLDVKLPDGDGWATFEELSRLEPCAPIVVITAWPNQNEQVARRGIDALMEKPLDLPLLLRTIDELIQETEQERTGRLAH